MRRANLKKTNNLPILRKIGALTLVLLMAISVRADISAQNKIIDIDAQNTSLRQVLKKIEKKTNYFFIYNETLINVNQKVTVKGKHISVNQLMDEIKSQTNIDYIINQHKIILTPKLNQQTTAQAFTVSGKVTDMQNNPMVGVTVGVKNQSLGAMTDLSGYYKLELPSGNETLVFSFIGYAPKEIQVNNRATINVQLEEQGVDLESVIVVGYSTSSKKLITGSVTDVNSEELNKIASYSLEGALSGKASGVQIMQNSGTPGSSVAVKIRGTASIYSGTQPLYVIDGVPMTTGNYSQIGYGGQGIDASTDINPNNIESITILKDASATAIYGARGANGVILITTKSGSADKTTISYRSYYGMQKEWKRLDLMNADQWKQYANTFNPTFVENLEGNVNTDWQNEVFRLAPMSNNELSLSTGNEKTQLYLSTGYLNQQGIIIGTGYEKYDVRANIDHKITNKLSLSFRNGFSYSINNRVRGDEEIDGVLPNAISMPPIYAVRDNLGNYAENGYFSNPVATANESTTRANTQRNISSLELKYSFGNGITLRNQWGADFYNLHERRIEPLTTRAGQETNGMIIEGRSNVQKITQQLLLDYNVEINSNNSLSTLLGYSFEISKQRYSYIYATNFPSVYPEYITSAGTINEASTDAVDEGMNSFFGRLKYNNSDKYIVEFSLRADGSSKFGTNNRYAVLPAGSFAWRLIEEKFMKNQSFFSDMKLKLGYGLTGNDQIGSNRYQNLYTTGRNYYNNPGLAPMQIPNPDLRWETSTNYNIGLDMAMFNDRLSVSAEYYYNLTDDLLLPRPLPGSSGFSSFTTNVGSIENKGIELAFSTLNLDGKLKWTSDFNIAFNQNKVLKLYNDQAIYGSSRGENAIIPGQPLGVFYMYESQGVDPSTGELVLTDLDGNGIFDDADKMVVGDPNPLFTGGFTNSLSFANFEFRVFATFSYGNDIYNGTRRYLENNAYGVSDNQLVTVLNQWQNPGDVTDIPRFGGLYNNRNSTQYLEDGSFLRIKELSLTYRLPQKALDKIKVVSNMSLYIKAQNLFTFTKYRGLDPEVNYDGEGYEFGLGTDFFTFPHPRLFLTGISIDF